MPRIGDTVTCAETGKAFVVEKDGITLNCATTPGGLPISDEGVDIREKRELLDRSKPFGCYVSYDGKRVTGWKGNTLGHVTRSSSYRNNFHAHILCVTVKDVHGSYWHGRGSGPGTAITLHPTKG